MVGKMSFSKDLLKPWRQVGEYVIVHEPLHLRVPKHGKLWKSSVGVYFGNYEKKGKMLKQKVSKVR